MDQQFQEKRLSGTFTEIMRVKNLDVEKLSQLTGVSERYIKFFLEEKFKELPAAPYIRGYLTRIAQTLNLDAEKVWQEYLENNEKVKRAGKEDRMPENRFIIKTPPSKTIIFLGAIFFFALIAFLRTLYLNSSKLEFQNLKDDITIVKTSAFTIKGKIDPSYKLTLNNGEIFLDKNGSFEKEVFLETGFNTFYFKAKKVLGKENVIKKQVFYQEEAKEIFEPNPEPKTLENNPSLQNQNVNQKTQGN